ncbi:MAG: hypothetical protein KDC91_06640, partial [Flavobacteriaceae bacterium]|nr:hypothetical protein [Flavobacteriaceae bacterium]
MKLHYYQPSEDSSNFGDELNKYIWEYYFPNFFDEDDRVVFFGIENNLREAKKFYPTSKIIIFGSGAHAPSQKMEPNFEVDFVRGPLSAQCLGLTKDHWI